ncbi:MAG TPA: MBL fold metallo-hydrolase [Fulvivirga sp.]|nr:MBL fold metallo-hydrolase [Fulvivirga sp.]
MILFSVLSFVALVVIVAVLFINLSPEFGGKPSDEQKEIYARSNQYEKGKFVNKTPTKMDMSFGETVKVAYQFFKGSPNREPKRNTVPVASIDSLNITKKGDSITRLTWFGHSAFLLEIASKNILIDPMFGPSPAPHPLLGPKRFTDHLPISVAKLPFIDAVIFSHDHYDHLDYGSIRNLKDKVGQYYVPLGLAAHLIAWGVDPDKIHELDWWEEIKFDDLRLVSTPARHFSGRGVTDRFSTLWCSWVIKSRDKSIYFSGDSGYGPHFKEIGEKYGPFDFAMMECGQYDERWHDIHMMPEETAQAAVDVKTTIMMPIHWASFRLAMHSWTDPIERVTAKAKELNMPVSTPVIGEPIFIGAEHYPKSEWWKGL